MTEKDKEIQHLRRVVEDQKKKIDALTLRNQILMQEEDRLRREIASLKLMVDQLHETTEAPRMLTIRQTAETGILPENTLRQFVKTGKVPFIRVGNRVLINYNKLCRMLEDC